MKERISLVKEEGKVISSDDTFEMPYLKFESKRRIDNLLNKHIENKDNEGYFFGEIRDIVRFGFKEQ